MLSSQISQAFAGLDTNRSVGVFGDQRVWGYIIILRAVRTKDFMSAEIFNFDNAFLQVSQVIAIFRALPQVDWILFHGPIHHKAQ
jgi:GMP synthase (glutamine-hydrolysing)